MDSKVIEKAMQVYKDHCEKSGWECQEIIPTLCGMNAGLIELRNGNGLIATVPVNMKGVLEDIENEN